MADVAACCACNVTNDQAVFLIVEEAAQSQGAEGQRIVQKHLQRRVDVRPGDQLENAVGKSGEKSCFGSVEIADQRYKQHTEQGDGAAEGQGCQLDKGCSRSQRDGHGAEDQLSGAHLPGAVFFAENADGCQQGNQNDGQKQVAGRLQNVLIIFCVVDQKH